ncbi:MAG TPA: hypothetical protein VFS15_05295 [Kofleriaceae bacterium]|nr:hypothetical protein [Kofleriaceae bacterium]
MLDATKALTVLAEIDPARRALLDQRLTAIATDLRANTVFRPHELPHTHFMRFVILEQDGELPALLAWESNHDRDARTYIAGALTATPIERVLECCRDYPILRDLDTRVGWLFERSVRAAAFYSAYRGVPREQVVNDRAVHDVIRKALDVDGGRAVLSGLPPCEIQRRLREYVRTNKPELDLRGGDEEEWRWALGKLLAAVFVGIPLLVLAIVVGPWWYLALRARERREIPDPDRRPVHDDEGLAALEDKVTQNQLTHVVEIKPGRFRYATLWLVLFLIDIIARVYSVRGDLGGITSIHFARWVILRDRWSTGRKRHRLLFFSNYDGSWESYLGEFIDRAAYGLTGVWSNTVDFPATVHLTGAGARDEEAFKQWTRDHQIPTQVWWSGVPDSTVQNVLDDIWIRRNLDRGLSDAELATWLRKL